MYLCLGRINDGQRYYWIYGWYFNQGGDTRISLTRWSVGHVSRQPNHWAINRILLLRDWSKSHLFMYKGIHAYCFINIQNLESGSDLWDCNNGLHYSSVPINQLFNTKNSFLQLPTSKITLKCKVLFLIKIFTNFFHRIVWRSAKLRWKILNLDIKIKHLRPVYKKDIEKLCRRQQS